MLVFDDNNNTNQVVNTFWLALMVTSYIAVYFLGYCLTIVQSCA